MQVAIVGLGRMGKNIVYHLLEQGVSVVAYNRSRDDVEEVAKRGAIPAYQLNDIQQKWQLNNSGQNNPIVVILFVPSGHPVDEVLWGARSGGAQHEKDQIRVMAQKGLAEILPRGSIIIDGGNSFYKDSIRRYELLKKHGIEFLDMGTSGGLEGARKGACLIVGGDEAIFTRVEPILTKIAVKDGYAYFGPIGAGHFVKMVHNGIEYALVQSFGEGFEILKRGPYKLNLTHVADIYSRGSVIRGWIIELLARALKNDPELSKFQGKIAGGETGV